MHGVGLGVFICQQQALPGRKHPMDIPVSREWLPSPQHSDRQSPALLLPNKYSSSSI